MKATTRSTSTSTAPGAPRTSGATSTLERLRAAALTALALAAALTLAACATGEAQRPERRPSRDPLASLPGASRYVGVIAPYRFSTEGLTRLEEANIRLGQSGRSSARLLLARAYLDAALYAELSGDQALSGALTRLLAERGASPEDAEAIWPAVESLFVAVAEEDGAEPQVREVAAEGVELVSLLRTRRMDADYHAALRRMATPGGPLSAEAQVGVLLDVHEILTTLPGLPAGERRAALVEVAAAGACPSPAQLPGEAATGPERQEALLAACLPASCLEARPDLASLPSTRRETVTLATCGWDEVGWSPHAPADLLDGEVAAASATYRRFSEVLDQLRAEAGQPMADAALPEAERLHDNLARRPLPLPLHLDAREDVGGLALATSTAGRAADTAPYTLALSADGLRLALWPHLIADPDAGGAALMEEELAMAFPGRLVAAWADMKEGPDSERARLVAGHLAAVQREALAMREAAGLEEPDGAPLALYVDADLDLAEVERGLDAARAALRRGGSLPLEVAVWDEGRGEQTFLPADLLARGAWAQGSFEELPPDARPLDLTLVITAEAVELRGRGGDLEPVSRDGGRVDLAALTERLRALSARHPEEVALGVERRGEGSSAQDLVDVLGAARGEGVGFEEVIVFSSGP